MSHTDPHAAERAANQAAINRELDQKPDYLSAAQHARAEALGIARQTVRAGAGPFTQGSVTVEIPELIDVAEYVINGTHPMERYAATEPSEEESKR